MSTQVNVDIMGAMLSLQRDIMFLRERVTKLEKSAKEAEKTLKTKIQEPWG